MKLPSQGNLLFSPCFLLITLAASAAWLFGQAVGVSLLSALSILAASVLSGQVEQMSFGC